MKAILLKELIVLKGSYGKRTTVTEYTLGQTGKTYRIGEVYDNVHQLKRKLRKIGYTDFEIQKIGTSNRRSLSY